MGARTAKAAAEPLGSRGALSTSGAWSGGRATGVALSVGLVLVALLDVMHVARHFAPQALAVLNLNGEGTVPAFFSAFLLAAAGALALRIALLPACSPRRGWLALGGLFLFMYGDEAEAIHEALERRWGIDWQVLYLPVFALAGAVFLVLLRSIWHHRSAARLFLAGAALWGAAQPLEALQNDSHGRPVRLFGELVLGEETLEMLGSLAFVVGLLTLLEQRRGGRALERAP